MSALRGDAAAEPTEICAPNLLPPAAHPGPIHAVQYDERVRILAVEFTDHTCYHFLDVPEPVYLEIAGAASAMDYFREHVVNRYAFRRIA